MGARKTSVHYPVIQALALAKTAKDRRKLLRAIKAPVINYLLRILRRISAKRTSSVRNLSEKDFKRARKIAAKRAKEIRHILRKQPLKKRRGVIVQRGGFLSGLLSVLLPSIIGSVASAAASSSK